MTKSGRISMEKQTSQPIFVNGVTLFVPHLQEWPFESQAVTKS